MRSGGNDYNYFKLTKLASFVQFKHMFIFCLEHWRGLGPLGPPWLRTFIDHMRADYLSAVVGHLLLPPFQFFSRL